MTILDQYGNPMRRELQKQFASEMHRMHQAAFRKDYQRTFSLLPDQNRGLRAKYDATHTTTGNELHWQWADHLDPHAVASLQVRRTLRSRSRYEIQENNPFLKGVMLTLASDMVGRGPSLQVTDQRISPERRKLIEQRWRDKMDVSQLRAKLWRMAISKMVDGESFLRVFRDRNRQRIQDEPTQLNWHVIECDRISTYGDVGGLGTSGANEVDGIRFDAQEEPVEYHLLNRHPGGSHFFVLDMSRDGTWVPADLMIHWFRQDRGWLRGIPELAPSLPYCALLRRYTLALVRQQEFLASQTVFVESDLPPGTTPYTDGSGNLTVDPPLFDTFPYEAGMITALPFGMKASTIPAVPNGVAYDEFVGSLLREITRPLMVTHNLVQGTSKDSNMASAVVDSHIYRGGQEDRRRACNEQVLDPMLQTWWREGVLVQNYFDDPAIRESDFLLANPSMRTKPPRHRWRWDRIGVEHTDPNRVANALKTLHEKGFLLDRDIQEDYLNRSLEEWLDDFREQEQWRGPAESQSEQGEPNPEQESEDLEESNA